MSCGESTRNVLERAHADRCILHSWWKDITSRPSWQAVKDGVQA
jgi:hypothetical protein